MDRYHRIYSVFFQKFFQTISLFSTLITIDEKYYDYFLNLKFGNFICLTSLKLSK